MSYRSPYHPFKCNICGLPIGGCPQSWMNSFRALYTRGWNTTDAQISAVAFAPHATVDLPPLPIDPDASSVTTQSMQISLFAPPSSHSPRHHEIKTRRKGISDSVLEDDDQQIPNSSHRFYFAPRGFLVHDSC
jgi:hypothetical protein